MKYTVKIQIKNQIDLNAGRKDKDNKRLPEKLEEVPTYSIVTDIRTSGDTQLTVEEMKTELRKMYTVLNPMNETLGTKDGEFTNPTDLVKDTKLVYSVTDAHVVPDPVQ